MTVVGGWESGEEHFNIVKNLISFGQKIRFRLYAALTVENVI